MSLVTKIADPWQWIYGGAHSIWTRCQGDAHRVLLCSGGFEAGDTSFNPGNTVVARSITLGEPVVYVSANYRLTGKSSVL